MFKFISKLLCEDLATGIVMARRKQRKSDLCPICDLHSEDSVHMLTCPHTVSIRTDLLLQFKLWLLSSSTDPSIVSFLLNGLSSWLRHPRSSLAYTSTDPLLHLGFQAQLKLGWFATLCGFITTPLLKAQSEYYSLIQSKENSFTWGLNMNV